MNRFLQSFLDNDSTFGRLMTRCGIVIAANFMFVVFSMPIFTLGAAYAALCHVMLKTQRGDGVFNPFKAYWEGFKGNFKQATIYWILLLALVAFGYVDVSFCRQMGGVLQYFMYALYAIGIAVVIVTIFFYPTMAAFEDTLPHLIRNAIFFAIQKPFRLIVMLFFNVFPLYLTYTDAQTLPLYGFIWITFGYGAIALIGAILLMPSFKVYLPERDQYGNLIEKDNEEAAEPQNDKSGKKSLKEMKKLGM